ncbi:hypothetical protein GGTG_02835 [Gaeumannomyces tritici R3-111a-1]|uniref:Uncharacterized protein n=1 Tax=Gaeumannomyces tritici (strain R3-111a-1) TaxID=644352 RepID=J3NNH9_GAET3|nr:hypothetical protein GGTG_02835 [Gaeumannomyces tritici R3-111a-1]EJT77730.1 hypothetical protein GGTG_02835 [Gaeumannomyces tritici R3-111a-1]
MSSMLAPAQVRTVQVRTSHSGLPLVASPAQSDRALLLALSSHPLGPRVAGASISHPPADEHARREEGVGGAGTGGAVDGWMGLEDSYLCACLPAPT